MIKKKLTEEEWIQVMNIKWEYKPILKKPWKPKKIFDLEKIKNK